MIIRNGKVFVDGEFVEKDLFVSNGKIVSSASGKVIDASGKYVIPGLIDMHVHFRDFGQGYKEDWKTASEAALAGGVTMVCDMPNNKIPITSKKLLDEKYKKVGEKALIDFELYISVNNSNVEEINEYGIKFVKLYYGETTGENKVDDAEDIFKRISKDIVIVVHAEDNKVMEENKKKYDSGEKNYHSLVRDNRAEYTAVRDLIGFAEKYDKRLHITHVSCKESAEMIKRAKAKGLKVTCDTCPHYLFLDDSLYDKIGNKAKVNPALKSREDREALWKYLNDGTIDCICSDHAPHTLEEKERDYEHCPSGFPGVETTLPLMLTAVNQGRIKFEDFIPKMTTNPARIFGIKNKGKLEKGYDADILIIDMEKEGVIRGKELKTKAKWTPFEGMGTKGKKITTIMSAQWM